MSAYTYIFLSSYHCACCVSLAWTVIVLGGSVAWGHYSEGCMCDSSVDTKCTVFKQIGHFKKHRHNVHKHCRWSSYVQTFLQDMLPGKTSSVTNLAKRSFSSAMYANVIQQKLFQEDIELNSSTIIFLDFSINDDPDISEGLGLEKLVRLIYTLAGDSPPMIVLLDMRAGHHQLAYKVCRRSIMRVLYNAYLSSLLPYTNNVIFIYLLQYTILICMMVAYRMWQSIMVFICGPWVTSCRQPMPLVSSRRS